MPAAAPIVFPPFRLDPADHRLWRADREVPLRPKTFAVLLHLARNPGRVVSKEELLAAVWPDTHVTDTVLKVTVRELRLALGDQARASRFVATVQRVGYRFVAPIAVPTLPLRLTSFVGRDVELGELDRRLGHARLVTLTGVGGIGKTRLAARAAELAAHRFEDGVQWVDLALLQDGDPVEVAVAVALGLRPGLGGAGTALAAHLADRELLLVLDNCESQLAGAAALALGLLERCPRLRLLCTSREPLRVEGEAEWAVPPLELPSDDLAATGLAESPAVALFCDRAAAVLPERELRALDLGAVAEVCRAVDGLPLAIELAAARLRLLSLAELRSRLDDQPRLLTSGGAGRHGALSVVLDASVEALAASERSALERLSVFSGGFELASASAVLDLDEDAALERIGRLVERSLVVAGPPVAAGAGRRYALLEPVRQYARDALARSGAADAAEQRHARHYLELATRLAPAIDGPGRAAVLDRLVAEQGNLTRALRHFRDRGDGWGGGRLAASLVWLWNRQARFGEARVWLEAMIDLLAEGTPADPGATPHAPLADCHFGAGFAAWAQGDRAGAVDHLGRAASLHRRGRDRRGLAYDLSFLGMALIGAGDAGSARRGRALTRRGVRLHQGVDDRFGLAAALVSLGVAEEACGDLAAARDAFERAESISRERSDDWIRALSLRNLGIVALRQGDAVEARTRALESLELLRGGRDDWFLSRTLETLGEALAAGGAALDAAACLGAAERLRQRIGAEVLPYFRPDHDRALATLRRDLDARALAAAWDEGRGWRAGAVLERALECARRTPGRSGNLPAADA